MANLARTFLATLALFAPAVALAGHGDGGGSILLGSNAAFDGDPASMRLSFRGHSPYAGSDVVGLGFVVPLTWTTTGEDRFAASTRHSVLELPPSARLAILPDSFVQPYLDAGLGVVWTTSRTDGFFHDTVQRRTGWMTRTGIGVEIGDPTAGVSVVVEPFSWQTYQIEDQTRSRFGAMLGFGFDV